MPYLLGSEPAQSVSRWRCQLIAQPGTLQQLQRPCSLRARRQRVLRCEAADPLQKGHAEQRRTAQSFRNRLQSNPAYQRLKNRTVLPRQKPELTPRDAVQGPSLAQAQQQPNLTTTQAAPSIHPASAISTAHSGSSQSPASQHSQSPGRNQSITFRPQNAAGKPRPFLQPLSAQTQSPYALAQSQPSVPRHVDFAEGVPATNTSIKASAAVSFWLTFHAEFGQRLRVVGSHKNLGSWVLVDGAELKWTEGDRWHANIQLPSGTVYEYKYVVLDSSGTNALSWQRGNNSVLAIKQNEAQLEVFDNWEGQPGAAVMAGGKSSTRENKLLDWATDIEGQLNLQRQELRQTRIELAAAQEEARKARQETRALRMELAQSQSVRAQADRLIKQLQSSNRMLKSELQATTTSFKEALHAAATRLTTWFAAVEEEEEQQSSELQQPKSAGKATDVGSSSSSVASSVANPPSTGPPTSSQPLRRASQPPLKFTSEEVVPPPVTTQPPVKSSQPPTESSQTPVQPQLKTEPPQLDSKAAQTQSQPVSRQATAPSGGLHESALESSTSSNARHHSTTSSASGGPNAPAQVPGATNGKPTRSDSHVTGSTDVQSEAEHSQPKLNELPKHSKSAVAGSHAAPLKASAGFPESAPSNTQETLDPTAAAGKQLEQSRTGLPPPPQESNTAATSAQSNGTAAAAAAAPVSSGQASGAMTETSSQGGTAAATGRVPNPKAAVEKLPAGEELQQKTNAIPSEPEQSNAAAATLGPVEDAASHKSTAASTVDEHATAAAAAAAAQTEVVGKARQARAKGVRASTTRVGAVAKKAATKPRSKRPPAVKSSASDETPASSVEKQPKTRAKATRQSPAKADLSAPDETAVEPKTKARSKRLSTPKSKQPSQTAVDSAGVQIRTKAKSSTKRASPKSKLAEKAAANSDSQTV